MSTPRSTRSTVASGSRYRHDPYAKYDTCSKVFYDEEPTPRAATPTSVCPPGTLHPALWGRVTFVEYPTTEFEAKPTNPDEEVVRVFIGQLPYFVTDMQLSWLCHQFGAGSTVSYPERIMKRQPNGDRLPTGCIHAYATMSAAQEMASGMHKRMLVDDTGVWHAQTQEEFAYLSEYIAAMKADKSLRAPNRPYDTVVIQLATSTYIPRQIACKPELAQNAVSASADVVHLPPPNRQVEPADRNRSRRWAR